MRTLLLLSFLFNFSLAWSESITLVDIPVHVFVNGGATKLDSVLLQTETKSSVKEIFDQQILYHDYTLEVHPNSNFETYWSVFEPRWSKVDLNNDGTFELIMRGKNTVLDEKEYVEIYKKTDDSWEKIYSEVGRLLAYKIHPNTGKIILYHHRYPCCNSASHNIFTVRLLNGKIHTTSRFFVGRDTGDMIGPFFPDEVNHTSSYEKLVEMTALRWSPSEITEDAFTNYSETNIIVHYSEGGLFKRLYSKDGWSFVLMYSNIVIEPAIVINPANFVYKPVYGWIQDEG